MRGKVGRMATPATTRPLHQVHGVALTRGRSSGHCFLSRPWPKSRRQTHDPRTTTRESGKNMMRTILVLVGTLSFGSIASAQTAVERGDYLVNGILTCGNCHTPRGPGGVLDMAK